MLTKSGILKIVRAVLCELTFHSWNRTCRCLHCAQTRDERHDWAKGGFCSRCGIRIAISMSDQHAHIWEQCKCLICDSPDQSETAKHQWHGCKCAVCGLVRDQDHWWYGLRCRECNERIRPEDFLKRLPIVTEGRVADFEFRLQHVDEHEKCAFEKAAKFRFDAAEMLGDHITAFWGNRSANSVTLHYFRVAPSEFHILVLRTVDRKQEEECCEYEYEHLRPNA